MLWIHQVIGPLIRSETSGSNQFLNMNLQSASEVQTIAHITQKIIHVRLRWYYS
jgi:hypothetical protein